MKIIGIIGWKNNGKTTLIEKLVEGWVSMGLSVSTIKHAHHDFDIDHFGKDSYRHRAAGAQEVIVASKMRWALIHEAREEKEANLEQLLALLAPTDLVIVEGYKHHAHPKIEVVLDAAVVPISQNGDSSIIAVACMDQNFKSDLPKLPLNQPAVVAKFILDHLHIAPCDNETTKCFNYKSANACV